MDVVEKQILFYRTADGKIPFQEWRDGLAEPGIRGIVWERLDRLRAGNLGDYKSIAQGVLELRIFYGPGYRIYVGYVSPKTMLILYAGEKDSQARDIRKALIYWADYWRRS